MEPSHANAGIQEWVSYLLALEQLKLYFQAVWRHRTLCAYTDHRFPWIDQNDSVATPHVLPASAGGCFVDSTSSKSALHLNKASKRTRAAPGDPRH